MKDDIDPYSRNADEERKGIAAHSYHIGESEGDIVVAFSMPEFPCDAAAFLDQEQANVFLGRFTYEMKQMGWLS
jgi:hypothetical protein